MKSFAFCAALLLASTTAVKLDHAESLSEDGLELNAALSLPLSLSIGDAAFLPSADHDSEELIPTEEEAAAPTDIVEEVETPAEEIAEEVVEEVVEEAVEEAVEEPYY